jgi:hypothetical protein
MTAVTSSRRRSWAVPLGALAGVLTLGIVVVGEQAERAAPPSAQAARADAGRLTFQTSGPCGGGEAKPESLAEASQSAGFQVLVPSDALASPDSLASTNECAGGSLVLSFKSGLSVIERANTFKDPSSTWEAMAKDSPGDTSVGTIQGQPAAFIDPAKFGAKGSVSLVLEGTSVVVVGSGDQTLSQLTEVAQSLKPSSA